MLLSIIIPVYNVENYLALCVESLLNKNYAKYQYEVILVDDGSTDKSGIICDKLKSKYENIKVIHKSNGGLSSARNAGIKVEKGEWISFIDSDDIVIENYIKIITSIIKNYHLDIVMFRYLPFNEEKYLDNSLRKITFNKASFKKISKKDAMDALFDGNYTNYSWNKVYKKSLFNKILFPVGKNFEDVITTCKLIDKANTFGKYKDILYFYRQRKGSILNATDPNKKLLQIQNSIQARILQLNFFNTHKYDYLDEVANHWIMKDCMDYISYLHENTLPKNDFYYKVVNILENYSISKKFDSKKQILKLKLYKLSPTVFFILIKLKNKIN